MNITHFHAHLYYEDETYPKALDVIEKAKALDYLQVGRAHKVPVGPHPVGSCQLLFETKYLDRILPWLIENRDGLSVFIHPVSGDDIFDHTEGVMFLGKPYKLNTDFFFKN